MSVRRRHSPYPARLRLDPMSTSASESTKFSTESDLPDNDVGSRFRIRNLLRRLEHCPHWPNGQVNAKQRQSIRNNKELPNRKERPRISGSKVSPQFDSAQNGPRSQVRAHRVLAARLRRGL